MKQIIRSLSNGCVTMSSMPCYVSDSKTNLTWNAAWDDYYDGSSSDREKLKLVSIDSVRGWDMSTHTCFMAPNYESIAGKIRWSTNPSKR